MVSRGHIIVIAITLFQDAIFGFVCDGESCHLGRLPSLVDKSNHEHLTPLSFYNFKLVPVLPIVDQWE